MGITFCSCAQGWRRAEIYSLNVVDLPKQRWEEPNNEIEKPLNFLHAWSFQISVIWRTFKNAYFQVSSSENLNHKGLDVFVKIPQDDFNILPGLETIAIQCRQHMGNNTKEESVELGSVISPLKRIEHAVTGRMIPEPKMKS